MFNEKNTLLLQKYVLNISLKIENNFGEFQVNSLFHLGLNTTNIPII